jgi:hypothetical protein
MDYQTTAPLPQYTQGQQVYDSTGNSLGTVVHSYFSEYRGWQHTLADPMSQYNGRFTLYTEPRK